MDAKKLWGFLVRNVSTKTDLPPFKFPGNLAMLARKPDAAQIYEILEPYKNKSSVGPSRDATFKEIRRRLDTDASYGGMPTLHSAIWAADDVELVQFLLELGADPDLPDSKKGLRPAQVACFRGRVNCMAALIQCDVQLHFEEPVDPGAMMQDRTPMSIATRYRRTEIVKLLEETDKNGIPCLVELCKEGVWFAVRSRVRRGKVTKEDLEKTIDGKNALEWARKNDNQKVASELNLVGY